MTFLSYFEAFWSHVACVLSTVVSTEDITTFLVLYGVNIMYILSGFYPSNVLRYIYVYLKKPEFNAAFLSSVFKLLVRASAENVDRT